MPKYFPTKNLIKIALLLGFFCFIINSSNAQEINIDSLEIEYLSTKKSKSDQLKLLRILSRESQDPQKKLKFSVELISRATKQNESTYLYDAYMQKGSAHRLKSDLTKALESFFKAADIAKEKDSIKDLANTKITLGDVYSLMGNHENSINYYEEGIKSLREIKNDSISLASALINAGDEFFNAGKYEKAMSFFYESSYICNKINYKLGSAYNLGNIGMVYAKQNKPKLAEANIKEAILILEVEKDYYPISVYLDYVADIYLTNQEYDLALKYATRSLELAQKYQLKNQIGQASLRLSGIYEATKKHSKSLFYYKNYVTYKDSVSNISNVQELANLRTKYEVANKQTEVDLYKQQKENERVISLSILAGLLLMSLLAFGLFRRNRYINKTKEIIDAEKKKSDELLRNILPEETANELKRNGVVEAKKYESVTVMFTDFKDFTKIAENLSPEKLVETVDMYFTEFDKIMQKYNLEKIKTIGDAYMCAAGIPEPIDNHAELMIKAAIEINNYVKKIKQVHSVSETRFDVRIGLHSGSIVAGVVGKNKFSYDIWGDTVNIASRIESASDTGKINVSEAVYQALKDKYEFENRGAIKVKNRGNINMYFLK